MPLWQRIVIFPVIGGTVRCASFSYDQFLGDLSRIREIVVLATIDMEANDIELDGSFPLNHHAVVFLCSTYPCQTKVSRCRQADKLYMWLFIIPGYIGGKRIYLVEARRAAKIELGSFTGRCRIQRWWRPLQKETV